MKRFYWLWVVTAMFLSVVMAGCDNKAGTEGRKNAVDESYEIKGRVVGIDDQKPSVKLDHEDIPGLMKAMTMEFRVADAKMLEGIGVGDAVQGQLRKDTSGYLITRLEKR